MDRRRNRERGAARALVVVTAAAVMVVALVTTHPARSQDGETPDEAGPAATGDELGQAGTRAGDGASLDIGVEIELEKPAPVPERGKRLFAKKCAGCHGARGAGDGPAARHLTPRPTNFTLGVFKLHSTPEGKSPTDYDLFRTITRGIAGTAMPSWMGLPVADRWQLVFYVESLSPDFDAKRADPITIPEPLPATTEMVERGRELYQLLQCTQCHGSEGRGNGPQASTLTDDFGNRIYPFDFSRSAKFKGGSTARDLYRTVHTGLGGTPMKSYAGMLTERDSWALVHYIRSLRVDAPTPPLIGEIDAATQAARARATEAALARTRQELAETREEVLAAKLAAVETRALLDQLIAEKDAAAREAAEKLARERAAKEKAERDRAAQDKAAQVAAARRRELRQRGWEAYTKRCAACHGMRGKGDGPAASGLNPRPRDFSDPAWQRSVTNTHIEKIMTDGGAAVGKSPIMPAQKDLAADRDLVVQLRKIIRGFEK